MASSEQESRAVGRGMSRRFMWFALAILAAIGLYTGGWYWAAGKLETETGAALARLRAAGKEADCTNATARGYPFRIGLYCDGLAYADRRAGLSLTGTGLRSAAQIYQPTRIVGEIDTLGLDLANPAGGDGVKVASRDIRFSTRISKPLPELVSVEGKSLAVADLSDQQLASATQGAAHFRPRGIDADLAGNLRGLSFSQAPTLPPLDIEADATVTDGIAKLASGLRSLRGIAGELRTVSANAPDGGVTISGPVSIDDAGLIDATLEVAVRNPPAVAAMLAAALPELAPRIGQMQGMIGALGDNPKIPLSIVKGRVRLAIFTIGRVPALD